MVIPRRAEVVVVGGGIVGLSTAWELAKRGADVVILEKGVVGGEQSGRNWGYVRQQARDVPELPLAVAAQAIWQRLEDDLGEDLEWAQRGNLRLIQTADELDWYRRWADVGRTYGVPAEILDARQLAALVHGMRDGFLGAMYTPTDGQANPLKATQAIARAAQRAGATLLEHTTASQLVTANGKLVGVETSEGMIACRHVVVAAGVWSRRLLSTVDIDLPLQRIRSTVAETAPLPNFPEIPAMSWTGKVSVRNNAAGGLVVALNGATDIDAMPSALNHLRAFMPLLAANIRLFRVRVGRPLVHDLLRYTTPKRRFDTHEPPISWSYVKQSREMVQGLFPGIGDISISRAWAGYIDGTPDSLPVVGLAPRIDGIVVGAGFSGHGFGLGPAVGRVLADLVSLGRSPDFDIAAFDIERFKNHTRIRVQVGR